MSKAQNKVAEIEYFDEYIEMLIAKGMIKNHYEVRADLYFRLGYLNMIRGAKVLEVGCGIGSIGRRLSKDNSVVGIDLCPKLVEIANSFGEKNYHVIVGDLEESAFENDIFDVILCSHFLHHLPTLDKVVHNFSRWLKAGGKIIIFDVNGSNLITQIAQGLIPKSVRRSNLRYLFCLNKTYHTIKTYTTTLNKHGIKVLECRTFYHGLPLSVWHGLSERGVKQCGYLTNFLIHRAAAMLLPRHLGGTNLVIVAEKH